MDKFTAKINQEYKRWQSNVPVNDFRTIKTKEFKTMKSATAFLTKQGYTFNFTCPDSDDVYFKGDGAFSAVIEVPCYG